MAFKMKGFSGFKQSQEGYQRNSPDVNNSYNVIPSGDITMKNVDFPVLGTDNLGNSQVMLPENEYAFPGDQVIETPLKKRKRKPDVRRTIGRGKNFNKAKSTGTGAKAGGGMTQKGVDEYKRKNPGSKLKTAVTTPPSKLKPGSKAAKRRKSFCARSKKWKSKRGLAARRRWNC